MRSYSNTISFPGLGIGEFTVNNVAFSVFGIDIAWYGIIITVGMIVAFCYASWRAVKYEKIKFDDMLDYAIWIILCGVVGARLYYIIMDDSHYTLKQIFALRDGGLAIYGGLIGGAAAAFVVTKIKKLSFPSVADAVMPGVMLAQAIGRWGNFMNGEAYGGLTNLPWRMAFTTDYGTFCVHPTFLYESVWNLIGFIIINLYYRKKKYNGEVALMCVTWYGAGRMVIEGLRTDSLYLGSIRISQLVAFVCFIVGSFLLILLRARQKKHGSTGLTGIEVSESDMPSGGDKSGGIMTAEKDCLPILENEDNKDNEKPNETGESTDGQNDNKNSDKDGESTAGQNDNKNSNKTDENTGRQNNNRNSDKTDENTGRQNNNRNSDKTGKNTDRQNDN